jgi:hypothetical protein
MDKGVASGTRSCHNVFSGSVLSSDVFSGGDFSGGALPGDILSSRVLSGDRPGLTGSRTSWHSRYKDSVISGSLGIFSSLHAWLERNEVGGHVLSIGGGGIKGFRSHGGCSARPMKNCCGYEVGPSGFSQRKMFWSFHFVVVFSHKGKYNGREGFFLPSTSFREDEKYNC